MKKRVRIYKAPDGEGKYINKTAKFLYGGIQKAQVGGAQAQQTPDVKKYMQYTYGQLSNDIAPEDIYSDLVTAGLSQEMAVAVINQVVTLMIQNGELDPDYRKNKEEDTQSQEQQDEQSSMQGQQQMVNAEEEAQQAQSREQNALAMPEEGDMDDEEAYLEDRSNIMEPQSAEYYRGGYMQDGGANQMMNQFEQMKKPTEAPIPLDDLIESTPGIQEGMTFPGIESYLPDYRPVDWEPIQALSPMPEAKKGGVANKKSFVQNVMSLVKKQNGGEESDPMAQEKANKSRGKGNPMDTYTGDVEKMKSGFIGKIKDNASKAASEKLYDTLSTSQDPQHQQMAQALSQSMDNPQQMQQQPAMQDGGQKPDWYTGYHNVMSPHQYRQYYRMLKRLLPRELKDPRIAASFYDRNMAPPFVTPQSGSLKGNLTTPTSQLDLLKLMASQLGIPMGTNTFPFLHVEDTDIFGRPKKYYIDYNGRRSAQLQADEVEAVNNSKYPELAPFNMEEAVDYPIETQQLPYDMIDSPVMEDDINQGYAQLGGYTGGENPLTRFVYGGGDESMYYEDESLPEAQLGWLMKSGAKAYDDIASALSSTKKYLTSQTPLKYTWKVNPLANKQMVLPKRFEEIPPHWLKGYPTSQTLPFKQWGVDNPVSFPDLKGVPTPIAENFHNPLRDDFEKFKIAAEEKIADDFIRGVNYGDLNELQTKIIDDATEMLFQKYGRDRALDFIYKDMGMTGNRALPTWGQLKPLDRSKPSSYLEMLAKDAELEYLQRNSPYLELGLTKAQNIGEKAAKSRLKLNQDGGQLSKARYGMSMYQEQGAVNEEKKSASSGRVDVVSENPKVYVAKDAQGNIVYQGEDEAKANEAIGTTTTTTATTTPKTETKVEDKPKTTIEPTVRRANVRYVPRRVTTPGGFYRTMAPWNPFFGYAGSWARQMGSPFMAGTNTPFTGSMAGMNPVARHVLESTMLRRRPKEWIDYYQSPGTGGGTLYRGSDGNMHYLNANMPSMGQEGSQDNELMRNYAPGTKYNIPMEEWDALSSNARGAIRQGERKARRNARRYDPSEFEDYVPGTQSMETNMDGAEGETMPESLLPAAQRDYLRKSLTLPDEPLKEDFLQVPYTGPLNEELEEQRYGGLRKAQQGLINLEDARAEIVPFSYNYANTQGQTLVGKPLEESPTYRIGLKAPLRRPKNDGRHNLGLSLGLPYSGEFKPSAELKYDYYNKPSLSNADIQSPYVQMSAHAGYDPMEDIYGGFNARTYWGFGSAKPETKSRPAGFRKNDWWGTLGPAMETEFSNLRRYKNAEDPDDKGVIALDPAVAWGLKGDLEWRPGKSKARVGTRYGLMFDPIEGKNMEMLGYKPNSDDRLQFAVNPQLEFYANYPVNLEPDWDFNNRKAASKLSQISKTTGTTVPPSNQKTNTTMIDGIPVEDLDYTEQEQPTRERRRPTKPPKPDKPCPKGKIRYSPGGPCEDDMRHKHPRWLQSGGSMLDKYQTQGQVNPFASGAQCPPGYFKDPSSGLCKNFAGQVAPSQMNTATATANQLMQNPFQATGTNQVTGQDYMFTNQQGDLQKNNMTPQSNFNRNPQTVGVRYKNENMRTFDPEAMLNVTNAGLRGVAGMVDRFRGRDDERNMIMENVASNTIYPTQETQHRGDWQDFGSMAGQYRFDQMGQDRSGFSSYGKYGGYMQQGGMMDNYSEGDEVMMTPEELEEFIANGGQVEYI